MKKIFFFILAVFLTSSLVWVSCKKDEPKPQLQVPDKLASQQFLNDIHWFLNAAKAAKTNSNAKCASTDKITLDSALYHIDAALNYTYAFPTESFADYLTDSVEVRIKWVQGEKKMYVADAAWVYNRAVEKLRAIYTGIPATKKELVGCIIRNAGQTAGNDSVIVRIVAQFGRGTYVQPSQEEEGYWWRRDSCNCDFTRCGYGAPNYLEGKLNYRLTPPITPGTRIVFTSNWQYYIYAQSYPTPNDILDNDRDYLLYQVSSVLGFTHDVLCISTEKKRPQDPSEMDWYLDNMWKILTQGGNKPWDGKLIRNIGVESHIRDCGGGILDLFHRMVVYAGDYRVISTGPPEEQGYPLSIGSAN